MDEAKRDEIRAWIAKASQDLAAAEWLLASPSKVRTSVSADTIG